MDARCQCGYVFHVCGADFTYFVLCPKCKQYYSVGYMVPLTKVEESQVTKNCCYTETVTGEVTTVSVIDRDNLEIGVAGE